MERTEWILVINLKPILWLIFAGAVLYWAHYTIRIVRLQRACNRFYRKRQS